MPDIAIKASGLVKWFGEDDAKTLALSEVGLEAYFGKMLYIVGPSASGKTTLLSVLSGILRPNSGDVLVEGIDIWGLSSDQLAEFRLSKIGFVFQDYHLFLRLTTAKNVAIPLILKRKDWDDSVNQAIGYLEIVGLKGRAQLPSVKLSGGEAATRGLRQSHGRATRYPDHGRAHRFAGWRHRADDRAFRATKYSQRQTLHRNRHARQPNL
jgi:putative ABC transport system ATP-binding protein